MEHNLSLTLPSPSTLWVALATTVAVTTSVVCGYHLNMYQRRSKEPPMKWSWLPFVGYALEMGSRPLDFFFDCSKQFKEIFGVVLMGSRVFFITDPHSYDVVFKADPKDLSAQEFFDLIMTKFFGMSHKSISGGIDDNLIRAWYSKYLFSDNSLQPLTKRMHNRMVALMKEKNYSGTVNLQDFIFRFVFDTSLAAVVNVETATADKIYESFCVFDKALPACAAGLDINYFKASNVGRAHIEAICNKFPENTSDLMARRWEYFSQLVKEDKILSSDPARLQIGIVWAAVGNSAPASFWMVYYLLKSPADLARVMAEIQRECIDGCVTDDWLSELTQEKLNRLLFADACITETLRLASGSLIMRQVQRPCQITLASGQVYSLRQGDRLGLCPPLTHYDEEVFPDSHLFNPSRWWFDGASAEERAAGCIGKIPLKKNGKDLSSAVAYLPFGAGPTMCPGRKFARNELKSVLVFLFTHLNIELEGSQEATFDGSRCGLGIFSPKEAIRARVSAKV